jgi:diguanylate cyclase (GGDEF)-like protein/PAS domain S-box-containing protein
MKDHHPILRRQIKDHLGTVAPSLDSLHPFLQSINDIYWRIQPLHLHSHTPKTTEQLLAHEQYRNIFESSSTAMTILSDDAVIMLANREFEKLSGYRRNELEGKKSLAEFFSTRDFESFLTLPKHSTLTPHRLAHRAETKISDRSGNDHHVLLSLSALQGAHQFIASFIDISERKRAEDEILSQRGELKQMNERLRSLHELSSVTTSTLDLKTMLRDVLHTVTRMELLHLDRKGIIFVNYENELQMGAQIGLTQDIVELHQQIDSEIALCCSSLNGKVSLNEVFACDIPHLDCAFAAQNSQHRMQPHIVVPLRSHNAISGIMCLYPLSKIIIDAEMKEMLTTIGNQIGIAIENALLYEKTKTLSLHDHLTGLPNRRFLQLEVERNFAKSKRYGAPLSLMMIDIDNFKRFNDDNGHTAGDSLLADIARIMLKEIRETDLAVRYGGEEFLILLPEAAFQEAFDIAERLRFSIADHTPVTVSIGLSSFDESMESHTTMISDADRALYIAKTNGKNRVNRFSSQMRLPLAE